MRAGAGKAEIRFPAGFLPVEGFGRQLDALHIRVLVLESDAKLALVSAEMTSLPIDEIAALKAVVSGEIGVGADRCWVMATHTFSAPHILPDHALPDDKARRKKRALQQAVREAAKAAAREAAGRMRDARLSVGAAECGINANRDIELAEGWWIGLGGAGPSDHALTLLRLDDDAGNPIALLAHFAVQSSVLDGSEMDGGKVVSGDLAGRLSLGLERQHPGAVALFLLGAAGDQSPINKARSMGPDGVECDLSGDGVPILGELAKRMLAAAQQADRSRQPLHDQDAPIEMIGAPCALPGQKMPRSLRELRPTRQYSYIADSVRSTQIALLRIGDLALVGVQPELNCVTAREIQKASPFPHTLVLTMVNGGAKYLADAGSYDRMTYEAMNSGFARGAAEMLRDEIIRRLI